MDLVRLAGVGAVLTLGPATRDEHGEVVGVVATVEVGAAVARVDGCSARYDGGFGDLVDFFSSMAADWRGWSGQRTWESLDHALGLSAVHDGHGHVQVAITLRGEHEEQAWSLGATSVLEPGEQMRTAAGEVARLLR